MSLRGVWHLICHVFMHGFDSFLSQAMFLSLQVFAFKGQNMKLILRCDAGPFTAL